MIYVMQLILCRNINSNSKYLQQKINSADVKALEDGLSNLL